MFLCLHLLVLVLTCGSTANWVLRPEIFSSICWNWKRNLWLVSFHQINVCINMENHRAIKWEKRRSCLNTIDKLMSNLFELNNMFLCTIWKTSLCLLLHAGIFTFYYGGNFVAIFAFQFRCGLFIWESPSLIFSQIRLPPLFKAINEICWE